MQMCDRTQQIYNHAPDHVSWLIPMGQLRLVGSLKT